MKLSIDIGNGYVKAINEDGEKLHFPTVIKENHDADIIASKNDYSIQIDGMDYFIGNLAVIKRGSRRWEYNKTLNSDTQLYIALCSALLSDDSDIDLVLGLPYSYYTSLNKGEALIKSLSNKAFAVEFKETKRTIKINNVAVYPQGVGAYFSNLYDIKGQAIAGAEEYIKSIYIDIGYRTVDVVAFEVLNGMFELIQENSFSLENSGIYNAIEFIAAEASKEFEMTSNDVEFAIRHNNSVFDSMYGSINLKKIEEKAYRQLADKISTDINVKLAAEISKYRYMFMTGGGALKLFPYLKEKYKNVELQDDYIFCNAKGYMALDNTK